MDIQGRITFIWLLFTVSLNFAQPPQPYTPLKHLNEHQLFTVRKDAQGNQFNITPENKNDTPLGTKIVSNRLLVSFLRTHTHANHPRGGQLFPTEGSLATLLDNFLTGVQQDTYFIPYFSRIHLLILHELFQSDQVKSHVGEQVSEHLHGTDAPFAEFNLDEQPL